MALLDLWNSSKEQFTDKHLQQIIAFAGDGKLRDGNQTTLEFREFLSNVTSDDLVRYADDCLSGSFTDSGLALQEVVNEVGRRLGFNVEDGRYRGIKNSIGFDGLWSLNDNRSLVVEVKTTDAYRIDLNTIADYRKELVKAEKISMADSAILIVVGRQDTGDLEAQIRGSRHAWDVRLISTDALLNLMSIKVDVEDPETIKRIHNILFPKEFTRLDEIVGILFSATVDLREEIVEEVEAVEKPEKEKKFTPVSFHGQCVNKIQNKLGVNLVKKSRASFASADKTVAIVCVVSKTHESTEDYSGYWFAFHPHQKDFLEKAENRYIAFGCGSADQIILIPTEKFFSWLVNLNQTIKEDRFYWHVHISKENGKFYLYQKSGGRNIEISEFLM